MQTNDKLIIGGKEFQSRFILGSGKYSLKLIEAAVKYAGAEIITLAVQIRKSRRIFWITFRRELRCFRIHPAQETPRRPCGLPGLQENWGAGIL